MARSSCRCPTWAASVALVGAVGLGCEHGSEGLAHARPTVEAPSIAEAPSTVAASSWIVLTDLRRPGGARVDLEIRDGLLVRVGEVPPQPGPVRIDGAGRFVVPAAIDSHVHLTYRYGRDGRRDGAERLADGGLAAAVDLAAPLETLGASAGSLRLLEAGPMLTAPGGYPTRDWGRDGYGRPQRGAAALRQAVTELHDAGARVIKVAMHGEPSLDREELRAVVHEAHALGLRVVVHALSDAEARFAAQLGADLLAHTPLQPLSPATVDAWSDRAVVSTLAAFGSSRVAVANLRALREAGATVLYGTDLGNPGARAQGISEAEIEDLTAAGLDGAAIVAAMTEVPAGYWSLPSLGRLAAGEAASVLLLAEDPLVAPVTLASPIEVVIDGVRRGPDPQWSG